MITFISNETALRPEALENSRTEKYVPEKTQTHKKPKGSHY